MRRTRAALLPFPGDPFLLHYWLDLFKKHWYNEVDALYINFNSPIEQAVVEYVSEITNNPKITLLYQPLQIEHGAAIDKMLSYCEEDLIMLVEDDGFIFKSGQVDKCFGYLESEEYDIVGSKRGSCSMEILNRAKEIWGLNYEGEGDQGCNFWPNFFFAPKLALLDTNRMFGAKSWSKGEFILELNNYCVQEEVCPSDTFGWASLQLRHKIPQHRIMCVPQYHASPDDLQHYEQQKYLFDGQAPWTHIGSLSSGVGGVLTDNQGRALARRTIDEPKDNNRLPSYANTDGEKKEWERRVQMWLTFWEKREVGKIDEFADLYYKAIRRIIEQYGLNESVIRARQRAYATLGL